MNYWQPTLFKSLRKPLAGCLMLVICLAGLPTVQAADKGNGSQSKEDLTTLRQLLKMPKEDLQRVRLTLEAIEKTSPEDRKKALQRIQNLNKMPTKQRKETIERWNELSPEMKKAYFDHLRKLSAKERGKFKALPWEKQIAAVKQAQKK